MEEIIKVSDLKKYYGDVKAVDGISFEVFKGEVLAILGPNGAGKTTTVEILEGLRKADSGRIYFFGKEVKRIDEKIKERIGVQLQNTSFLENLTVKETLNFLEDFIRDVYQHHS
ncbi:MAG: type transport system ATP-binding protein [Thermotogaceae bacterium]|nr:type transport system ATP-binding protein [Thermotogaceae bacterium]